MGTVLVILIGMHDSMLDLIFHIDLLKGRERQLPPFWHFVQYWDPLSYSTH